MSRSNAAYGNANNWPKTAESLESWLDAIQLPQYKERLAHLTLLKLRSASQSELKALVQIDGHRRRLLLALEQLELPSASESPKAQPSMKFNSTSSLYINSTIVKPNIDEIIFCVSIVIYDRIEEGEGSPVEGQMPLEEKFINKPLFHQLTGGDDMPSEDAIFQTIKSIYSIAEFSAECLVISLLYIERVRSLTQLQLRKSNWQPLLLAAIIVAQKVWDDKSLLNVDFSMICSAYTLKDINTLEKQFLEMIQYNVSISASLYASYYFELRTLCEKAERTFTLKPLSDDDRRLLETDKKEMDLKRESNRRWQSAGGPPIVRDTFQLNR